MRRSAAVIIASLVLAACANEPAPTAGDGSPEPAADTTRLDVYEAMIREVAGAEEIEWKRIVVVSKLCDNAASAEEPKGCTDAFTVAERDELRSRLGDLPARVEFMDDPTPLYDEDWLTGAPEILVVRLGPIAPHGDGVEVGGSYGCGGLCGSGTTYLLEERATGWRVVGTTGTAWIA